MKKFSVIIVLLILGITCYHFSLGNNKVFSYGSSMSFSEIVKVSETEVSDSDIKKLYTYSFKKAIVKNIGSTTKKKFNIDNHTITIMGNRNLVQIDHQLYQYSKK